MNWKLWFQNPAATNFFQLVMSFIISFVVAPWSLSFIFFIIFTLIYELLYGYANQFQSPYWNPLTRLAIVAASIIGWIGGRLLTRPVSKSEDKIIW